MLRLFIVFVILFALRAWSAGSRAPVDGEVTYTDVTGDGLPEALVNRPGFPRVYVFDKGGRVRELEVPSAGRASYSGLFGSRRFFYASEGGQLVERHHDSSGRTAPLVVRYRWEENHFEVESVAGAGTYHPSYDCGAVEDEPSRAICHVEELAELDRLLASVWREKIANASTELELWLVRSQHDWFAKRDAACAIDGWWVACLTLAYQMRIDEIVRR